MSSVDKEFIIQHPVQFEKFVVQIKPFDLLLSGQELLGK
jgi:hypothetical protein